jgi:hypothetical protein
MLAAHISNPARRRRTFIVQTPSPGGRAGLRCIQVTWDNPTAT